VNDADPRTFETRANLGYHYGVFWFCSLDETLGIQPPSTVVEQRSRFPRLFRTIIVLGGCGLGVFGLHREPASLMDDVDAVKHRSRGTCCDSGDWVRPAKWNAYLEKSPLKYWLIAIAFKVFGVHDWVARLRYPVGVCCLVVVDWAWHRPWCRRVLCADSHSKFGRTITATTLSRCGILRARPEESAKLWSAVMLQRSEG